MAQIKYHRQWPSLLKEALAEGLSNPADYVWDNVDDPRAYEVSRDTYIGAIRAWCASQPQPIYRQALAKIDAAQ